MKKSTRILAAALLCLIILASGCTQQSGSDAVNANTTPPNFPNDSTAKPPAMPSLPNERETQNQTQPPPSPIIQNANQSNGTRMYVGDNITVGGYTVKLDDIGICQMADCPYPAAFSIYDENGTLVAETQASRESKQKINLGNEDNLTIEVFETQPGFTLGSKWADVNISLQAVQSSQ